MHGVRSRVVSFLTKTAMISFSHQIVSLTSLMRLEASNLTSKRLSIKDLQAVAVCNQLQHGQNTLPALEMRSQCYCASTLSLSITRSSPLTNFKAFFREYYQRNLRMQFRSVLLAFGDPSAVVLQIEPVPAEVPDVVQA